MTEAEARALWVSLAAAFPSPRPAEATHDLYLEELQELADAKQALEAVRALVRDEWRPQRLPTIGEIRGEYQRRQKRAREEREREQRARALPAGERQPIPDEVLAQLHRFGVDVTRLTKPIDPEKAA